MKKVDVTEALKTMDGKDIINPNPEENGAEEVLRLKTVLVNSLLSLEQDKSEKLSGEAKVARFGLAQAIFRADGPMEIGNSDIALLKKLVNTVYPTLIVGQVYEMLDKKTGE